MPVNTGPDSNNYSIPEVVLSNTFNTWKDQSNLSAYKLNKLKVYSGVSSSSVSLTTTALEGVLTAALLPTVLTGHTFSAGIQGTQAAFHTFNAAGSTLTIGSNATSITMGVAGGSATILSHLIVAGNFFVGGTLTTTSSANFTIADSVISLGQTGAVGVTGAIARAQDRGIAFFYPDTDSSPGASLGFFGAKAGSRNFVYLLNGSTSGTNIHSGVTGTFEGNFLGKDFRGVCGGSFVFTDSTGKTVGFQAPPAITTPTTWYLPVSDGTNGQLLGTNGAGQLVWDTAEPAGSTGMIQYNDGSGIAAGFSANSNLVFTVAGGLTGTTMSATLLRATGISAAGITTSGLLVTTGITYNGTIAQTTTGSTILPVRNQYKTTTATWNGAATILSGTSGDSAVTSSTTNLFRFFSAVEPGFSSSSGPFVIVLPPGTTTNPQLPTYNHFVKIHISGRNRSGISTGIDAGGMSTWECVVSGYLNTVSVGYNQPKWYSCDVQCTGRTPFTIVRTGYLDGGNTSTNNASRTNAVIVLGDNTLKTEWPSWSVDRIDIGYGGNFADQTLWEGQFLTSLYNSNALISTASVGTNSRNIIEDSLTTMPVKLDVGGLNIKKVGLTGGNLSGMNLLSKYSLVLDGTIANAASGITYNGAGIAFAATDTSATLPLASIFYGGEVNGGSLNFATSETYGNGLNKIGMTIHRGKVGIGITAPAVALDVVGAGKFSQSVTIGGATFAAPSGTAPIFGARAYVSYSPAGAYSSGVALTRNASGNVSSVTAALNGGTQYIAFTTPMPSANYTVTGNIRLGATDADGSPSQVTAALVLVPGPKTVNGFYVNTMDNSQDNLISIFTAGSVVDVVVFG